MNDERHMSRAVALARKGFYTTDPNPRVGCVLVKNEKVVGEGWHEEAGAPHAEINALQRAQGRARGATAYVTLEPCCHVGHTGPCTRALIEAGVVRCGRGHARPKSIGKRAWPSRTRSGECSDPSRCAGNLGAIAKSGLLLTNDQTSSLCAL